MHELSLAQSLVELVTTALPATSGDTVRVVHLKVGELAGVVPDALRFCYEIATRDTPLEGSALDIRLVPVMIHCPTCDQSVELPGVQHFRCPICDTPSMDIRQGKELEVESVEIETSDPTEESS